MKKRFKGEIGVQDYITREHAWYVSEAEETGHVIDGATLLQVGSVMVRDSADWRFSRRDAVRDVLNQLRSIRDSIEHQIAEIKEKEELL